MENELNFNPCLPGGMCCYTILDRKIVCEGCLEPTCYPPELLEADKSAFHTDELAAATRAINQILSGIPKDSEGREPALIQTRMGIVLVWVTHKVEATHSEGTDEIGVTSADDNDTIAKALNLKNY